MIDRNLARGLFLAAVSLAFGIGALRYPIGDFGHSGPGLFPLMVSSLLMIIAIITIVRSRLVDGKPMEFNFRNAGLILFALCSFALVTKLINMTAAIVIMVFIASFAGSTRSWKRSAAISAGLLTVAFAFQRLLGLALPLY